MLAYLFWHSPRPDIDRGSYVDHLVEFHQTLARNKSSGFRKSVVFRIRDAGWLIQPGWIHSMRRRFQARAKNHTTE